MNQMNQQQNPNSTDLTNDHSFVCGIGAALFFAGVGLVAQYTIYLNTEIAKYNEEAFWIVGLVSVVLFAASAGLIVGNVFDFFRPRLNAWRKPAEEIQDFPKFPTKKAV